MTRYKFLKRNVVINHYRILRGNRVIREMLHEIDKCLKLDKRKAESEGKKLFFIRNYQWLSKKNQVKYKHMHEMRIELSGILL
ncbi:MAG: hypothetical protein WC516_06730 [Patescibacteria group bacterium]|jgi:hypothetical protein